MKLKANDTLHISSVGPENILPGAEFDVSDAEGQRLIDAGYAVAVKGKAPAKKKAAEPENKMQPITLNKADPAPKRKRK